MSYLLFLDESGHDHRSMPYEVRGGVVLHASKLWPFVQAMQQREIHSFGAPLDRFGAELKGCRLLDKDRFRWASQQAPLADEDRRLHCRSFLQRGLRKETPRRVEFTAYGQACLEMATGVFELLREHDASLFAAAIPRGVARCSSGAHPLYLRKDHVFLLERYFYFLQSKKQHGLLVMDECEKNEDRRFVRRLQSYFRRTQPGRRRATWIVPTPFFVSSEMTYPLQAADLAIYCINWGFRLPRRGMQAGTRPEIAKRYGDWLAQLQFRGAVSRGGQTFRTYGIVYVPDPHEPRGVER
ncbi:MAG: DUF3800 domain-containing protein [Planctomycetota bacterium]|nr:MAG: DUF3800 domain-containing protein [Planctomycetota bacterium]